MVGGVENAVACAVSGRGYGLYSRLPRAGEHCVRVSSRGGTATTDLYLSAGIQELAHRDRYGEDPTWKPCRHYLLTLLLSPFSQTVKEKNIAGLKSSLESELSELGTPTGRCRNSELQLSSRGAERFSVLVRATRSPDSYLGEVVAGPGRTYLATG